MYATEDSPDFRQNECPSFQLAPRSVWRANLALSPHPQNLDPPMSNVEDPAVDFFLEKQATN